MEGQFRKSFFSCEPGVEEQAATFLEGRGSVRVERIVSFGHATPEGEWYEQNEDEWCLVLEGEGRIAFEDGREIALGWGGSCFLPRHLRHRVAGTSSPCVWLCIFGEGLALDGGLCPGNVPVPAGLAAPAGAGPAGLLAEETELC